MNHTQCVHTRILSIRRNCGTVGAELVQRALQSHRRQLAEPQHAIDVDRVVDPHPLLLHLRVVVGGLVRRHVRPHLQAANRHIPARGAAHRDRQTDRRREGQRLHRQGRGLHVPAQERRGDAGRHHPPGGCSHKRVAQSAGGRLAETGIRAEGACLPASVGPLDHPNHPRPPHCARSISARLSSPRPRRHPPAL